MAKYSTSFKQRVVELHEQNGGLTNRPRNYSVQFKRQVLQTKEKKHRFVRKAHAFFNIPSFSTLRGRSRNAGHPTPPAQIRTCATNAYGSYLECILSNRLFGQGCTTLGCGSASRKN